jgi:tRNA pseudouridine32 synthase / 23S rRNA pseudouridine746 synthase
LWLWKFQLLLTDTQIVHVDESMIVLEKPAGLLAVPGRGAENQDNLATQVQHVYPEALVVHRLDRDTSGLIVMARGLEAQRNLSRQFEIRIVEKRYIAVVYGSPVQNGGRIDLPMRKDFDRPPRQCVDFAQGRPAITEWRVIERHADRVRLELAPLTGRSHQLRLHLEQIGQPILGDKLYAHEAALALADRLLLHATRLSLVHPASRQVIAFTSACPF